MAFRIKDVGGMSGTDTDDGGNPPLRKIVERSYDWVVERDRLISLWARASSWTPEEGIALAFNKDPKKVISSGATGYGGSYLKVPEPGGHFLDLAERAKWDGRLSLSISPLEFISWAEDVGLSFDPAWRKAVARRTDSRESISPKDLAISASDETGACEDAANNVYLTGNKESDRSELLNPKARTSLLKLVIGMAIAGYRFNPRSSRNDATKEISDDLERLGIPLDRDTILRWLREGAELLPGDALDHDKG
jgi:hypothetical protein